MGQIRGHIDVQHLVARPQRCQSVISGVQPRRLGEHDDPGVILTKTDLVLGADHAVGDMPVGLTSGDLEVTRKNSSGKRHDHEVVNGEVRGAAHDAPGCGVVLVGGVVVGPDVNAAVPDGLAVLLRFLGEAEDTTDHERTCHLRAGRLNVLDGQPEAGEGVGDLLGSGLFGQAYQLT